MLKDKKTTFFAKEKKRFPEPTRYYKKDRKVKTVTGAKRTKDNISNP